MSDPIIMPFAIIPGGNAFALFVMPDGTLQGCGINSLGQLGLADTSNHPTPTVIPGVSNAIYVSKGGYHSLVVLNDGSVMSTGYNNSGQLGDGTTTDHTSFATIPGVSTAVLTAGGFFFSMILLNDGTIMTFGHNFNGQLGLGDNTERHSPTAVPSVSNVVSIDAGIDFSILLLGDGTLLASGDNLLGQLGNGSFGGSSSVYVPVGSITGAISVASGAQYSLVLLGDGTVLAFGSNSNGQLGNGDTTDQASPVPMLGITNAIAIAAGGGSSYVLLSDGTVMSTGFNGFGQLGDGTTIDKSTPSPVLDSFSNPVTGIVAITTSGNSLYMLRNNGTVLSLGDNEYGQLGFTENLIPNPIPQLMTFSGGAAVYRLFDSLIGAILCVHPNSIVFTKRGKIPIKDVVSGDIVYSDGKEVEVKSNVTILRPTNEFIVISKNSLGYNIPQNDLYIKSGHPVMHRSREFQCDQLINKNTIKKVKLPEKVFVHTLCTENRVFVNIENLPVCTWCENELNNEIAKGKITYTKK